MFAADRRMQCTDRQFQPVVHQTVAAAAARAAGPKVVVDEADTAKGAEAFGHIGAYYVRVGRELHNRFNASRAEARLMFLRLLASFVVQFVVHRPPGNRGVSDLTS
jgi:hypothetical protein